MQERWQDVDEFPGYAISSRGVVLNTTTDLVKKPSTNQQGILMANFSREGRQHIRSVATLVARAFLSREGVPDHFDTPIHLNGDKSDCRISNMEWRPRWFAVSYHKQFSAWERENKHGFLKPVELLDTEEIFPTSWEAAIKYGLLDHEIFVATINRTYVFPHRYTFREVPDEEAPW